MLLNNRGVLVKGNRLTDSKKHIQPDTNSKGALLGLHGTKHITLDGKHLSNAPHHVADAATILAEMPFEITQKPEV